MRTPRSDAILDPGLEAQPPAARRALHSERLRATLARASAASPRARRAMEEAGIDPADVRGVDDLPQLPILRKDALPALQAADPPFGGLVAAEPGALARLFMSPGPIFDPQGPGEDPWRFRHALAAAGLRRGEVVHNAASYHLTPLGFMLDGAARALGCAVIPAGVGQTEQQIRAAAHFRATAYLGTPSFLRALLGRARDLGTRLDFEVAFVLAEMLPEPLRAELGSDFGVRVLQGYGTADLGCLAYECPQRGGWHVHPEAIVEVLDPSTGRAAPAGEPGEVVATVFDPVYPLLRFATGDLSTFAAEERCPCGRTTPKLAGLLGRVGDGVKVKGVFVRASQLEEVLRGFPEVARLRAVVTRQHHQDELSFEVELAPAAGEVAPLRERLAEALREALKVRGEIAVLPAGSIPADAKRIDDRRVWR